MSMDGLKPLFDSWSAIYDRGAAVGESRILDDMMVFRYRDEVFELPVLKAHPHACYNGYFWEIPIDKLRALVQSEKKNG